MRKMRWSEGTPELKYIFLMALRSFKKVSPRGMHVTCNALKSTSGGTTTWITGEFKKYLHITSYR